MATSGEVPGRAPSDGGSEVPGGTPSGGGSEDLSQMKCQPCLEICELREVVGMCIDCVECMCGTCFKAHRQHKPCRHHKLIDREQMTQDHMRVTPRDTCTDTCQEHEYDVIKYYCINHCVFGCTLCITQDHKTCDDVQHIPSVAKDLDNNEEYKSTESRLKSAIDTLQTVSENIEQKSAELETSCLEALEGIREFRRSIDDTLGKIEIEIIEKLQEVKSEKMKKLTSIREKYKSALTDLQSFQINIEMLQNAQQHCRSYMEMMKTKEKVTALDAQIKEAEMDMSSITPKIQFSPNHETLDSLRRLDTFGVLLGSGRGEIVGATHARDVHVKTGTDTNTCLITGIVVFPDDRLVLTDHNNKNIKVVSIQSGEALTQLKLSSAPRDITTISSNKVAVTMTGEQKITMVTVDTSSISVDRHINVNGRCYGVYFMNNKLAVSYCNPDKVQVLTIQGCVLHDIASASLNNPEYLTFGHDDTTLYVSNYNGRNVVCLKLDGTIVATYADSELQGPEQPVVDSNGNVIVCGYSSRTIHQINKEGNKTRVLLSETDGLSRPYSVCLCEKKDLLYVGMLNSNVVKVYKVTRAAQ